MQTKSKGFTLIELLVVVIIVGVLAAVSLPNLVSQIGKARETEHKNTVGTINRSQQAYHWEKRIFADGNDYNEIFSKLGLNFQNTYISDYKFDVTNIAATVVLVNENYQRDSIRAYSGGTFFDNTNATYSMFLCQSETPIQEIQPPTLANGCIEGDTLK
ncbi:prepilin-type N-terminal cleavage/methylation domain-containing protein [Cyanobacterium stanieri LEGE 03274]|uniref:Prepilin-type N-terminal cleavage/methylation domain-containing protein n=1 Tax=Cyanobacterium stanieri LEGE 03274 TaxID=1828756 RepID=A0ABR9V053_9CHRO|nr:prepilin-type N-terminal cleavage/methylation domain-containing protein [Cyanobacterium stanieri LEGE 03274]